MNIPDPDALLSAVYAEEFTTTYQAVLAALQGDQGRVGQLLGGLPPELATIGAIAAVVCMAEVIRQTLPQTTVTNMIRGVEEVIAEHAANRKGPLA